MARLNLRPSALIALSVLPNKHSDKKTVYRFYFQHKNDCIHLSESKYKLPTFISVFIIKSIQTRNPVFRLFFQLVRHFPFIVLSVWVCTKFDKRTNEIGIFVIAKHVGIVKWSVAVFILKKIQISYSTKT